MHENENASHPRKKRLGGCMISVIVILSLLGTAIAAIAWGFRERRELFEDDERAESRERETR